MEEGDLVEQERDFELCKKKLTFDRFEIEIKTEQIVLSDDCSRNLIKICRRNETDQKRKDKREKLYNNIATS